MDSELYAAGEVLIQDGWRIRTRFKASTRLQGKISMRSLPRALCYFGLIAPIWLLVGVTYSGMMYPGYSHLGQALSELHAVGSPIESIAPFINHYPLSILFAGFGFYVISYCSDRAAKVSGVLIVLHGVATFSAGYFPCDVGCVPETPSMSHLVHGISGLLVLITLLIAPAIWMFIATRELKMAWFGWFSAAVFLGQLLMMIPTVEALATGENFGLYQRLAYSIPLAWLFVFALVLMRDGKARLDAYPLSGKIPRKE